MFRDGVSLISSDKALFSSIAAASTFSSLVAIDKVVTSVVTLDKEVFSSLTALDEVRAVAGLDELIFSGVSRGGRDLRCGFFV
jgi:hypothetical protein